MGLYMEPRDCRLPKLLPLRTRFVKQITPCGFSVLHPLQEEPYTTGNFHYPSTYRGNLTEVLHGKRIEDPYRWLEDSDNAEVTNWVERQMDCTSNYMKAHSTTVANLQKEMTALWDYEKFGTPFRRGNRYFFFKNDGLQNQYVLSMSGKATVLLDVNTWRTDGTAAFKFVEFSEDGLYLAYGISLSGSDWTTIYVRDVASGKDLSDKIEWVKFSGVSWTHDNLGFFYSRYPEPSLNLGKEDAAGSETAGNRDHMVYYHLSTSFGGQGYDTLVYKNPEKPKWLFSTEVSDSGDILLITANDSCDPVNCVYFQKLEKGMNGLSGYCGQKKNQVIKLIDNFDAEYNYITNEGNTYFFRTNLKSPNNRIISIEINSELNSSMSKLPAMSEVLPEHKTDVLQSILVVSDKKTKKPNLIVQYMRDCQHILQVRCLLDDKNHRKGDLLSEISLPAPGSVGALRGRRQDSEFFYSFTSFLYPGTIFHGELHDGDVSSDGVFDTKVSGFDRDMFITEQVFYKSKDGMKVPMFITRRCSDNESQDSRETRPTVLYGYGGFNISLTPSFSVTRLAFMKFFGGTFVVANLRGGGEYGKRWHEAGQVLNKQNVFDDFIAAAEYLTLEKYTTPKQLAIMGGSNGGLLVASCVTQRPELFAAAICQVPVTDMLRFHKFTIGYAWCSDFGNAEENEDHFKYMLNYSPVHNTHGKEIPATLVCTADHDDRVVPLHSYKFTSALQNNSLKSKSPALIRVDVKAGHGAGKPTAKVIAQYADIWAFTAFNTGATFELKIGKTKKFKGSTDGCCGCR